MRNGAQAPRGGTGGGGGGGLFSARSLSSYMRIVSSGASTAASTLRSAGASLVNSIASHDDDAGRDQVQWAGFDKLECGGDVLRQVLLLAYRSGFQVWDVEHADDVRQLESRHDGAVSFIQLLKKPIASKRGEDRFVDARPLLALAGGGTSTGNANSHDVNGPVFNGTNGTYHNSGSEKLPTIVRFYSLKEHGYVHSMKFRSAVYSIRCSPRVVAVSQATQIHCFDAATLELDYTLLTSPIVSPISGYGPLGLGPRWIVYSGSPVPVPNTGRVTPQLLSLSPIVPPPGSNGSVVAYYAKESSKQLAAGIVTLGDVGYKKLSRYYSDLIPNGNGNIKQGNAGFKANGVTNGHTIDSEYAGTVIVRDIVSKAMVVQFRAHTSPISALCFDPSGTLLVTASIHGRNINVFRIMPSVDGSASEDGPNGTYVHLFKLQRGITNAVIKDISFSDDSEWILISSSRGTSHFFAISPYSGSTSFRYSDNNLAENNYVVDSSVKHATHWSQNASPSLSLNQKMLSLSGPPVALSVVSRIRNGSNLLKGAVHGAAAFATGVSSPISGAIASTFHNCKGGSNSDGSFLCMKYYLLVFSPSGSIIQYVLHHSAEPDSGIDYPSDAISYGSQRETDTRFVIEPLQKWDVCQKKNRRDTAESNLYNDFDSGENNKIFQKVVRKGTSIYPSNVAATERLKLSTDEKHNYYISESELQTHVAQIPVWSRSGVHFQVIGSGTLEAYATDNISGEIEIEKVQTHNVESRSKNLIPVFESLHTSRFQQTRVNTPDSNRSGFLQRHKSGFSADGRLSSRSSCSSLDCMSEVPNSSDDNSVGQYLVEDSAAAAAVNKNLNVNHQAELVNNTESLNTEAQLGVVNSKDDCEDSELLPDLCQ
ncbi:Breast carcinoma-amplified sequence 3-like protein [Hordeum vulgare]|nr:Breast carcinoma-amplified sequence 3-like protein [Hordeum vulgare]